MRTASGKSKATTKSMDKPLVLAPPIIDDEEDYIQLLTQMVNTSLAED